MTSAPNGKYEYTSWDIGKGTENYILNFRYSDNISIYPGYKYWIESANGQIFYSDPSTGAAIKNSGITLLNKRGQLNGSFSTDGNFILVLGKWNYNISSRLN